MFEEGLTFDDVLLSPQESDVLPAEVEPSTWFTPQIRLAIPIVSSPMDTVTESKMAVALAQAGGLGIIHRNLLAWEQAAEVGKVKKSEGGMVIDPVTLGPDQPLGTARQIWEEQGISGFPVVENGKLLGLITHRDFQFEEDLGKPVKFFMTPKEKLITVKEGVHLEEAKQLFKTHRIEKLPIVDEGFRLKGLITIKDLEKSRRYPYATKDSFGRLRVGAAIGVGEESLERAAKIVEAGVDVIVIDTAHGHTRSVVDTLRKLKKTFPKVALIAGNVATEEGAKALCEAGADALKVGMGPGSICTTRVISGVGVPQISAVQSCAKVAKSRGIPLIADGGIRFSGDVVKALAAGAQSVMIGSLFAGTDEAPGEVVLYQGRSYKVYRGMGSLSAMQKGSGDRYGQLAVPLGKFVPEGVEGRVPYRGKVADTIFQLMGGVAAGMGYVGARSIKELQDKVKFIRVSQASLKESHVHDVIITQEAPNYRLE